MALSFLFLSTVISVARAYEVPVVVESVERAVLSAEASGVITSYLVDAGSEVKKGEALAKLDTKELELDLLRQKQTLNFIYKKIENLKKLVDRGLATNEEIDQLRLERDVLRSEIKLLEYRIERATIKAPFAAKIVQRLAQPAEWVQQGEPVVELLNVGQLQIVSDVPADFGARLNMGDKIQIRIGVLQTTISAVLTQVAPAVDVKSNTLRVYAEVENPPAGLLSGMSGMWLNAGNVSGGTTNAPSDIDPNLVGPPR